MKGSFIQGWRGQENQSESKSKTNQASNNKVLCTKCKPQHERTILGASGALGCHHPSFWCHQELVLRGYPAMQPSLATLPVFHTVGGFVGARVGRTKKSRGKEKALPSVSIESDRRHLLSFSMTASGASQFSLFRPLRDRIRSFLNCVKHPISCIIQHVSSEISINPKGLYAFQFPKAMW